MADDSGLLTSPDLVWGSQLGTYELRMPGQLLWSPGLMRLYDVSAAPRSAKEFFALVHPEDRARVEADTQGYMRQRENHYSHSFRIIRPTGEVRIILDRGSIERDAQGHPSVIRGFNVDVTDEAHLNYSAERQLRASEERYRKLFDAISQGFCILEVRLDGPGGRPDHRVVEANAAYFRQSGMPKSSLGAWLRDSAPGLEEHWYETYAQVARTGESVHFESRSDYLGRWFEVDAFRLDEPDSSMVAVLFSDVTERHQEREQMQFLVNEINHRSKNMLGVIQAIARNTAATDAKDFAATFSERVRGLAASNDLLVRNGWRTVDLDDLIRSQLEPFSDLSAGRVSLEGAKVALSPVATRALGMALHELATNAVKYGALSNADGQIRVAWSLDDGPDGRFHLTWTEAGGPTVSQPSRHGFGTKVTKVMVEFTTGGRVAASFAPEGFAWQLDCPRSGLMA